MPPRAAGHRAPPTSRSAPVAAAAAAAAPADGPGAEGAEAPVLGFLPADPQDPRLTPEGAVVGADGKVDVSAYEDLLPCYAGEPPPDKHPDPERPGVRAGEVVPKGLRLWDDLRSGGGGKDGAGWIAIRSSKRDGKKEKWFNIRTCGSWRMAFLLARLQRELWDRGAAVPTPGRGGAGAGAAAEGTGDQEDEEEGEGEAAASPAGDAPGGRPATPRPARKRAQAKPAASGEKPRKRPRGGEEATEAQPGAPGATEGAEAPPKRESAPGAGTAAQPEAASGARPAPEAPGQPKEGGGKLNSVLARIRARLGEAAPPPVPAA